jgi:hypothetical protein
VQCFRMSSCPASWLRHCLGVCAQEFTGLGRAEAIELLYQFGGDPHAVMAHLFP